MDDIDELSLHCILRREISPRLDCSIYLYVFINLPQQNSRNEQDEKDLTNDYFPDI